MEPTLGGAIALARGATGPLSPHLEAFVVSLIDEQYSTISIRSKAWHAVAFDAWLARHDIAREEVLDTHIDQFHCRSYQPRSDCRARPRCHEVFTLHQLLCYLRAHGLCLPAFTPSNPADKWAASFEHFLLHDRGIARTTIRGYRKGARDFLIHRFSTGHIDLGALNASNIIDFIRDQARQRQPRSMKSTVNALRAFLRYLQYRGEIDGSLIHAVPAIAGWRVTPPLPRAISSDHARRVIDGCDIRTAIGLRDRAILLLLARLGLRGCELIALRLDDVDWDAGCLNIRGKNGRECLMPMPVDVGEAITQYLQEGRPQSPDRHLFLRSCAPIQGLRQHSDGIGSIVRHAVERANIDTCRKGSHQFRHALAVRMLEGGASLPEIGDVLRHRSPLATSVYARVNVTSLRPLALPWPGGAS